ncbi:hypothetical protein UFOVP665_50 [uncultured Caudovirales phage]|uniref:Uncharacterized protein n=1 Tax=uncultured Caudovirales phage TaxID=2100421 RepID=A0A6J5NFF3_9CAUD|nr:hypothetical protein UFOVP665_50 [uncultured Caudovirales phage]
MATTTLNVAYLNGDTFYAADINATNTVVNALSNGTNQVLVTAKGDLLSGGATANALVKTAVGAASRVLITDSTASGGIAWGQVTSAMITDLTIVGGDIAATTITGAKLVNGTITSTQTDGATVYQRGTVSGFSPTSSKVHISTTAPGSPAAGDIWFQI